jgi:hypothetical protein
MLDGRWPYLAAIPMSVALVAIFATIGRMVVGDAPPIGRWIAILNVFVLTPAGIYLPVLFRSLRDWRALAR